MTGLNGRAQTYVFGTTSYPAPGLSNYSPPMWNPPMVTADFNRDGIPDVAIVGTGTSAQVLSVYLGKADGTLAQPVNYDVGGGGLTVGDFDGDQIPDLVVTPTASTFPQNVNLLIGNGDGTFQAPVAILTGAYTSPAAGDFNGDGKMDLAIAAPNYGSSTTLAVALGNGDGTFQALATYAITVSPYLAVGDFNGDGKSDVAVTGPAYSSSPHVSVFLGSSTGTLQGPVDYAVTGASGLAVADMNGDGKLDLIVPYGGTSEGFDVLPGMGDGTFASPLSYTSNLLSAYSTAMAVADFNGDGNLDLAFTNSSGNQEGILVVTGKGDGTFQDPPVFYGGGLQPAALVALDLTGDGKPDLAAAGGYGTYTTLTVMINRGDGTFPISTSRAIAPRPYLTLTGDFNGDGKADVATPGIVYDSNGYAVSGFVSVLPGNGDGSFKARIDTTSSYWPDAAATGDFNKDGKLDIAVIESSPTSTDLAVWLGNGDGTFHETVDQAAPVGTRSLAVGDFNKDGNLDVASVAINDSNLSIFLGHGDGTFSAPTHISVGPMSTSPPNHTVRTGDFNNDGRLDLAVATDNGIGILLGNGNGTFQPLTLVPPILSYEAGENILALADFNKDGKLDILRGAGNGTLGVALGNGNGTFQAAATFSPPSILDAGDAVVDDFNADGKLDVAFAGQSSVMTLLLGNGDGTFGSHIEYSSVWSIVLNFMATADFNSDGVPDITLSSFDGNDVSVYLSSPVAAFYPQGLTFANQALGTASPDQIVTLSNSGAAPLSISSVTASGDFIASNQCDTTLGKGNSCQVSVSFAPTAGGARTGTLSFVDNASATPQILKLSGTGTGAGAALSTASLSFGTQHLNMATAPQTVTVSNAGDTALNISGISASGDFSETNTCGTSVTAGANCTISVTFTPTATGLRTGSLTLMDNAANSPQSVDLSGTGNDSSASRTPASLDFTAQLVSSKSAAQTITLSSTGGSPLAVSGISVSGDFAQTNTCGTSVAAGADCTISVTFTPTAAGSRTGTVTITDNALDSPQTVDLSGTGVDFSVAAASGSSTSATVSRGQTATYNLSVAPTGGLSGTISFTCSGAPAKATCTVSPASFTTDGTSGTDVTVSVVTTAQGMTAFRNLPGTPQSPLPIPIVWLAAAALLACAGSILIRRPQILRLSSQILRGRARRTAWAPLALLVAILAIGALASCGGGGGSSPQPVSTGTPTGTYNLTVTATFTSGSMTLTHNTTLSLKVQ